MSDASLRTLVEGTVSDMVKDLLDYSRRNDDELTREALQDGIQRGIITQSMILHAFTEALHDEWPSPIVVISS